MSSAFKSKRKQNVLLYIHLILVWAIFIPGYSSPVSLLQYYQIPICVKYSVESYNTGKRHANATVCLRYRAYFCDHSFAHPASRAPAILSIPGRSLDSFTKGVSTVHLPYNKMSCSSRLPHWQMEPFLRDNQKIMKTGQMILRLVDCLCRLRLCIFVKSAVTGRWV